MSGSQLLADLRKLRAAARLSAQDVARLADLPLHEVGRIENDDPEVGLRTAIGYAAAVGAMLAPRLEVHPDFPPGAPGGSAAADGDLADLRSCFAACRTATGLAPTALGRHCGLAPKAVFALERGPSGTNLSVAAIHAARFGLILAVVPRGRASTPDEIASHVERNLPSIKERIASGTKPSTSHHVKTPKSEMEAAVADVLARAYARLGTPAREFARTIGVDWKTIAPGGAPSFTGRLGTTTRAASALGYRIVAIPDTFEAEIDETAAVPTGEPDLGDGQSLAIGAAFAATRGRTGLSVAEIDRRGGGTAKTTKALAENPLNAKLDALCRHASVLGLRIVAVPESAAEDILAQSRAAPEAGGTAFEPLVARSFDAAADDRKRKVMASLLRTLGDASAKPRDLHYRVRMSDLVEALRRERLVLTFSDEKVPFRFEFGLPGADAGISAFMELGKARRVASGLSLVAFGEKAGITGDRVWEAERARENSLASSIVLYAEALGLGWRIGKAPRAGRAGRAA